MTVYNFGVICFCLRSCYWTARDICIIKRLVPIFWWKRQEHFGNKAIRLVMCGPDAVYAHQDNTFPKTESRERTHRLLYTRNLPCTKTNIKDASCPSLLILTLNFKGLFYFSRKKWYHVVVFLVAKCTKLG